MVASLKAHGLAEPILGYTHDSACNIRTFLECIPSLNKDVQPVSIEDFSDLQRLTLPEDVSIISCHTGAEISSACLGIIEGIRREFILALIWNESSAQASQVLAHKKQH